MKIVKPTRGGIRKPVKLPCSQQRALSIVIDYLGGPTAVARKLGVARQLPINWKIRGRVPLEIVGQVGRTLGFDSLLLNYEEVSALLGSKKWWETIVREELKFLSEAMLKVILAGIHPKEPKELMYLEPRI